MCSLAGMAYVSPVAMAQADYPSALWNQADSTNFTLSNRPNSPQISYVIIHITEGSYSGAISWFKNPSSDVSAHFVLRSSDGQVTQMVRERDIAWHAGVWSYNQTSVGIEHEATSLSSSWYTDALYRSSAQLTRYLTTKYSVPRTRSYIIGHKETGRATSCPGPYWDWTRYMALVTNTATFQDASIPTFMTPRQQVQVVVRLRNDSLDTWLPTGTDRVELGTAVPANRVSPFYVSARWINSARPAAVSAATVPGAIGEFKFPMMAPATVGTYTETYQLYRASSGYFGPQISFTIGVGQLDRIIDNTDAGMTYRGTWSTGSTATDMYGTDYRYVTTGPKSAAQAVWNLNAPVNGRYDVYAWWPAGTNRAKTAVYEISDRREKVVRVVDQSVNGGSWQPLGRVALFAGTGWVRLNGMSSDTGKVVVADGIRLVGPF